MALSEWDKKNLTGGQQRAVLSYTEAWEKATRAGDAAAARKAHEGAEAIRKQAGYSGGSNGAGFTAAGTSAASPTRQTQAQDARRAAEQAAARYARETASDAAKQAIDARLAPARTGADGAGKADGYGAAQSTWTPQLRSSAGTDHSGGGRSFGQPRETSDSTAARVGQGILSALTGTGARLTNAAGTVMDTRGGTAMRSVYEGQVSALDSQIAALERIVGNTAVPLNERAEAAEALAIAQGQRGLYAQAVRANEGTARELYRAADAGQRYSREQAERSVAGTSGLERIALSAVPEVTNLALDTGLNALAPGLGTTVRAMENAGGGMMDYRAKSGAAYDPRRAAAQGALSAGGSAAGAAASWALGGYGEDLLRARGLTGQALPEAIKSGTSAAAYALGETGGGELGRAVTEDSYTPDLGRIASRAASAFAFSFANELLKSAAISARDKQYVRGDLADAQEKYATALEALTDPNATPEQRVALARSAMDHSDWARYRLGDFGAAGREAVQAREALTDIIEDLRPYAAGYDPFALDSGGFSGHNTLDPLNITPLQDESFFIGKSLGSRSKNYQIDDKETGIKYYFAEGTRVENPTVFAGYQGTKPLEPDTVAGLVREYGGNPNKWQHAKGIGTLAVGEDEIRAEVHWFQEESVGKVKFKIKRWLE